MIYDRLMLHNIEEVTKVPGKEGVRLQRVPQEVSEKLNENAQKMYLSPVANVEIRFMMEGDQATIVLSTEGEKAMRMHVTWGGMLDRDHYEIHNEATSITIRKNNRYKRLSTEHTKDTGYAHNLVRLSFSGQAGQPIYYHCMKDTDYSTPTNEDLPQSQLIIYGTSITHGANASGPHLTYPFQAVQKMKMDLINLGCSGSALCEEAISDYIAARDDWDIAVLSVSVNAYNREEISLEMFKERVSYMVDTIASTHLDKDIFCITLLPFFDDVGVFNDVTEKNAEGYRQVVRDVVNDCVYKQVHLLEGKDLLTDFNLLSSDLIHPNDLGMIQIGHNLAHGIQKCVKQW